MSKCRKIYVVDAELEENIDVLLVFEYMLKFDYVLMMDLLMNQNLTLQFFLQFFMGKHLFFYNFAGIFIFTGFINYLIAFSKTSLYMKIDTFPRTRPFR
jgi:hypothetical protein